ncbi:MAG: pantetheine-phosphate adenylyltransferase [Bacteroidetes bacterium GWE2_29_8]|nr:MAG: pantetheine-phosphate adenylyltransferase [Bacteroidetes bacterium GWE2_29_8]OFY24997.1 MAG: pantetheine-phosphate adenylyltransferase [Bacteroidetes bacterium GWF2_29_10]
MKLAVFPGSFDPITKGHESIVHKALTIFDELIIGVGVNSTKKYYFTLEKRIELIKKTFEDYPNVKVEWYEGMTVDFCRKVNSRFIIRGLRNAADFEFEKSIALTNHLINKDIETIMLLTDVNFSAVNSTLIRDILSNGGNPNLFVPEKIKDMLL